MTPWLVPVLAALLLGCGSSKGNGDSGAGGIVAGKDAGGAGATGGADASVGPGSGIETYLLKMDSVQGVSRNPPVPTTFTLNSASYVTRVWTYHYGATIGSKSPTVSFKHTTSGAIYGPWPQTGYKSINAGLGAGKSDPGHVPGPPDNYWMAYPAVVIPAGTYQVVDSDPATWACTADQGNRGLTWIYGWTGGPPAGDGGTGNDEAPTISVSYAQGDMAGQTAFYDQLTPSLDKTAAALIQAVFTVNTFLFTDPAVTSFETFKARKAEADQALDVLAKYAAATESLIDAYSPDQGDGGTGEKVDTGTSDARASIASDAGVSDARASIDAPALLPMRLKSLTPEEVLATVSSGPANAQIKTLMRTYNVNAKKAQLILNTAMAGLDSQAWNDEGKAMDTLMRQATLLKETAKLSFTIVGTVATAGGLSGTLGAAKAAQAIISGAKGAIAVSKAGVELVVGKDVNVPDGSKASLIMTTVSTVSDIIAIGNFQKILDGTATGLDALKGIATVASKVEDAFVKKTITFGELKVTIKDGLSIGSSVDVGYINNLLGGPADPPSTLPGSYKINGVTKVVPSMPRDIISAITKFLPSADIVKSILVVIITPDSPDAGVGDGAPAMVDAAATFDAGSTADKSPTAGQLSVLQGFKKINGSLMSGTYTYEISSPTETSTTTRSDVPSVPTYYMSYQSSDDVNHMPIEWSGAAFAGQRTYNFDGLVYTMKISGTVSVDAPVVSSFVYEDEVASGDVATSKTAYTYSRKYTLSNLALSVMSDQAVARNKVLGTIVSIKKRYDSGAWSSTETYKSMVPSSTAENYFLFSNNK